MGRTVNSPRTGPPNEAGPRHDTGGHDRPTIRAHAGLLFGAWLFQSFAQTLNEQNSIAGAGAFTTANDQVYVRASGQYADVQAIANRLLRGPIDPKILLSGALDGGACQCGPSRSEIVELHEGLLSTSMMKTTSIARAERGFGSIGDTPRSGTRSPDNRCTVPCRFPCRPVYRTIVL
jgi:hypothetical protein